MPDFVREGGQQVGSIFREAVPCRPSFREANQPLELPVAVGCGINKPTMARGVRIDDNHAARHGSRQMRAGQVGNHELQTGKASRKQLPAVPQRLSPAPFDREKVTSLQPFRTGEAMERTGGATTLTVPARHEHVP